MNIILHEQYQKTLAEHLDKWSKRKARALSDKHRDAALILLRLDLDPLRPLLLKFYSTSPRGRVFLRVRLLSDAKFGERLVMSICFEVIDHTPSGNAI